MIYIVVCPIFGFGFWPKLAAPIIIIACDVGGSRCLYSNLLYMRWHVACINPQLVYARRLAFGRPDGDTAHMILEPNAGHG